MALLPQRQRDQVLFMVCLFSLGALGLYYQYVWSKKQTDLDMTQERVETLEALNARAKRDMARGSVTLLKKEADRLRGELDIMRQLVPTSNEVPVLLDQVSTSARRVGLEVFDVQPDTNAVVGQHFDVQRYRMIVSGDYHNIAAFFTHVGSLTRIVTPQNVELTISRRQTDRKMAPLQARLEAKFEIQTYVARGMPEMDGLATTAVGVNAQGGRP